MQLSIWFGRRAAALLAFALVASSAASAGEFSVTPIRAELKPGAMSETITVSNEGTQPLRVTIRVMAWTQDANGKDIYTDSGDLVYFPRVMDVEPGAKRLVRVGAKNPGVGTERTYRLFIEEVPPAASGSAAVSFYFRFGVPVFLPPAGGKSLPRFGDPLLQQGRVLLTLENAGSVHFRAAKLIVSDGAGWSRDYPGWYSLAGTSRTYEMPVPAEVCRGAKTLTVKVESEGTSFERKVDVTPASCS